MDIIPFKMFDPVKQRQLQQQKKSYGTNQNQRNKITKTNSIIYMSKMSKPITRNTSQT